MKKPNSFLRSTLMDISDLTNQRSSRSKNQTFNYGMTQKEKEPSYNNCQNHYTKNIFHQNKKLNNIINKTEKQNSSSLRSSPIKFKHQQNKFSKDQTLSNKYFNQRRQFSNYQKSSVQFSSQVPSNLMAKSQYIYNELSQTKNLKISQITYQQDLKKIKDKSALSKQKSYFRQSLGSLSKLIKNTLKTEQSTSQLKSALKKGLNHQKSQNSPSTSNQQKLRFCLQKQQNCQKQNIQSLNFKQTSRHTRIKSSFQKTGQVSNKLKYSYVQDKSKDFTSKYDKENMFSESNNNKQTTYYRPNSQVSLYSQPSSLTNNFRKQEMSFERSFKVKNQNQINNQKLFKKMQNSQISINDFKLGCIKGEGRFGKVYPAFHKKTGFLFAIKQIKKQALKYMLDQFIQELKIQLYLNHPNIVKTYGYFSNAQNFYIIMQYMEEGSLYSFIKKNKKLNEEQASSKLKQICSAIEYTHENEILHRDIKPQNIVMTCDVCKLCDFGWAIYSNDRRKTYCGTLDYVCPQILEGESYDNCVDIWAMGVMAYEMLTGKAPFYNISKKQTMRRIMECDFDFPNQISEKAKTFIKKSLKKNPGERYSIGMLMKDSFLQE